MLANPSPLVPSGNGLQAVDMPDFWLGNTSPAGPPATGIPPASISIPNGVNSLRLAGVDASRGTLPGVAPTGTQDDTVTVTLGLPRSGGTRIVVDQVISSTQPAAATAGQPAGVVQHGVDFSVSGRLDLFQADSIVGDPDNPERQFPGGGGTVVTSFPDQALGDHRADRRRPHRGGCHQLLGPDERAKWPISPSAARPGTSPS